MGRWDALKKAKRKVTGPMWLSAFLMVPVSEKSQWQILAYRNIKQHKVAFENKEMKVQVKDSASPMIYPLGKGKTVSSFSVKGSLKGNIDFRGKKQGKQGADDFRLRIGLVVEGKNKLGFWQKLAAPQWVKTLFSLAPEGAGIDKIYFFNLVDQEALKGSERQHPLSEYIHEKNVWFQNEEGPFEFTHTLNKPLKILAIWISIDGDDTKSSFETSLSEIKLETP